MITTQRRWLALISSCPFYSQNNPFPPDQKYFINIAAPLESKRNRHNRNGADAKAPFNPTGKSLDFLSSPISKNNLLPNLTRNTSLMSPSCPTEGRIAIVTDAGRDAVDAGAL